MASTIEDILRMADSTRAELERVSKQRKALEEQEVVLQEELSAFTRTIKAIERRDGRVGSGLIPPATPPDLSRSRAELVPSAEDDERTESKANVARRILREGNGLAPIELYNKLTGAGVSVGKNYIHSMLFKFKNDGLVRERRGKYYWNEAINEDSRSQESSA